MPPPTVTAITPATRIGAGAFPVEITGTGFEATAVVWFGGYRAPTTFVDPATLTATFVIPASAPSQTFPVTVRNATGGASAAVDFVYVIPALITLPVAKQQLRITDDLHDEDVTLKSRQAETIILDYLKPERTGEPRPDWPWTALTLPMPVQAAMLLMLTHLYEHRGDDMAPTASGSTPDADVWKAIENLLIRFRDPALAGLP